MGQISTSVATHPRTSQVEVTPELVPIEDKSGPTYAIQSIDDTKLLQKVTTIIII